jgi:enoyl-CoA hydratase/carnithine racemase
VRCDRDGAVAIVSLRAAGALERDVHAALARAAHKIDHDDGVRTVVLALGGAPRGARGRGAAAVVEAGAVGDADGVAAVASLRVPVIAALRGAIVDEALELALACDLRVAAAGTRLGITQIARGELPLHGGTQRLPRLVGRGAAMRMLLLGEMVEAGAARALGLVSEVAPGRDPFPTAMRVARRVAARGPIAQRLAKEALLAALDLPLAEGLRLEGDLYVLLQTTRDRDEGIASFRERRAPAFGGH